MRAALIGAGLAALLLALAYIAGGRDEAASYAQRDAEAAQQTSEAIDAVPDDLTPSERAHRMCGWLGLGQCSVPFD